MSTTVKILSLRMDTKDYDTIRKYAVHQEIPSSIIIRKFIKIGMKEAGLIPNIGQQLTQNDNVVSTNDTNNTTSEDNVLNDWD
jgi:hypothetical protein